MGGRISSIGTISSTDGKRWILPAENNFLIGTKLPDLYNECNRKTPLSIVQVDTASVPLTDLDSSTHAICGAAGETTRS